ncbi:MAG: TonB-dependent receptor [Nibricoccus sp.]
MTHQNCSAARRAHSRNAILTTLLLKALTAASVLTIVSGTPSYAQSNDRGNVSGRIYDETTQQFLRNAIVSVKNTEIKTLSEDGGRFFLANVPAGAVEIEVTYAGLSPVRVSTAVQEGKNTSIDISLGSFADGDEIVSLDAFLVTTSRSGNAKAMTEQQHAENMKKVISSDTFGKIPENNVGEFLKLMPGVSADYVEADVRAIRIRGYDPKYASVMIDGQRVAMAGSSTIGTSRTFEFEQLSISSIETVELSKTPTPDQPSSAAGTVNLRSKSPLDRKERFVSYSASLSLNSLAFDLEKTYGWDDQYHYKARPNFSLEYSENLIPNKLGILVTLSRSDVYSLQQAIEFTGYTFDNDRTNNASEIPPSRGAINFQHGLRPTVRQNGGFRLDYRFTPELSGWFRVDYNTFDNQSLNRNFRMNIPTGNGTATTAATQGIANAPNGPVVPGVEYSLRSQTVIGNGSTWQMTNQGTGRHKFGDTRIYNGNLEFRRGDLLLTGGFQFSRAANRYESLDSGFFDNTVASTGNFNWSWTRSSPDDPDGIIYKQLTGPFDARSASAYTFGANSITAVKRASKDQIWSGRIDGRYKTNLGGAPIIIKSGLTSTLNVRDVWRMEGMQYTLVGPDGIRNSGDNDLPINWVETGFASDWGFGGNANGLPVFNRHALARYYASNPGSFTVNTIQHLTTQLQNQWDFKEQIDGAYLQSIFTLGKLDIAPGVRFERTYSWGKGVNDIGDAAAKRAVNPSNPGSVSTSSPEYVYARYGTKMERDDEYGTTLGYLHGTYRFTDNLLLRSSYHTAITRANMDNIIPGVGSVNESTMTVSIKNPELRPEMSRNYNVSLEYYFSKVGLFTVSAFRSDIEDLQATVNGQPITDPILAETYPGFTQTSTYNVGKSHNTGAEIDYSQELTFLPPFLRGVGVFGNYTRLYFDDWKNYHGSPKHTANAGVSYNRGSVSAQFRVNSTGKKRSNTEDGPGWDKYEGERTMCDLSASYSISRHFALFANGKNIFDEVSWNYTGRKEVLGRYARFGAFWEFGVKGTF